MADGPMKDDVLDNAWRVVTDSIIRFRGKPVGTVAAKDPDVASLNYDQVFTRDFAVSSFAFLMKGESEIVRNFLLSSADLQSREDHLDCFRAGHGLMPASFKVDRKGKQERLVADFGEKAVARVTPVDAGFWWVYILYAYVRSTGDPLHQEDTIQQGIRWILDLAMTTPFDMLPTLLVPDGSFMIDRRLGCFGHPLDIQVLFYAALRAGSHLLSDTKENHPYIEAARERAGHLIYHLRRHYWMDVERLNELYRSRVDQYGKNPSNPFNIYPASIPEWLYEWLPDSGGYFVGSVGPARMDFRFYSAGNLMAILTSLADPRQTEAIVALLRANWRSLVGHMPLKDVYPALEGDEWRILTGGDPKNTPWSYQNAGGWPFLIWLLAAAGQQAGAADLPEKAMELLEARIVSDRWPEYYDGPHNRLVGREARHLQTWSAAGYIIARLVLERPELLHMLRFDEDDDISARKDRIQGEFEHNGLIST